MNDDNNDDDDDDDDDDDGTAILTQRNCRPWYIPIDSNSDYHNNHETKGSDHDCYELFIDWKGNVFSLIFLNFCMK